MTIQVAVMNGYGLAMASDRHVFRGNDLRSTGQDVKLLRLRGPISAAMMASGPFAVFGVPVSRLALRLERALASAPDRPEALAEAVLSAISTPLDGAEAEEPALELAAGDAATGDGARAADLFLTVGMVCPATGVPVLLALRLWRGAGGRLHYASRLETRYEAAWRAGRTVVVAQGSGRALIEAMIDGLGEDHWAALPAAGREAVRSGMDSRWDRAHGRLGIASPRELAAIATGLVRGAEVVGFLTREAEGTVADVDCLCLTPREIAAGVLPAGTGPREAA